MVLRLTIIKCFLFFILFPVFTNAQVNFEAGSDEESALRDLQLLQQISPHYSFTVRPLFYPLTDSSVWNKGYFIPVKPFKKIVESKYIALKALPLSHRMQWNTHSVWGRNNGSFISSKGFQQIMQAGLEINSDFLDIRVAPDLLFVNDPSFEKKTHVLGGQSMVRLKAGRILAVTAGTEQLWWGPAIFSSLLMSNNAPGFPHISLQTFKPLILPIGVIEFQMIGGQLKNRKNWPMENFNNRLIESFPFINSSKVRYFSGLNFAFQPIFLSGLTIGFNRSFQYYNDNIGSQFNFIQKYIPVVSSIFKKKSNINSPNGEDALSRDQLFNIFTRYLLKEANLEVYGEFGWNDHKYNLRDLVLNPDHSAAFTFGFRKIFSRQKLNKYYKLETEYTQMAPTNSDIARGSGNWYTHYQIGEGYTQFGQIIGGGITPGDNLLSLRISQINKTTAQSIKFEKYQHDPQFFNVKWTDWCLAFRHQQYWKAMTVSAGMELVRRTNFQHAEGNAFNLQPSIKLLYNW